MKKLIALMLLTSCVSGSNISGLTEIQKESYYAILEEADLLRCEHAPQDNYQHLSYLNEDLTAADLDAIEEAMPESAGISIGATGFEVDMNIRNEACE